MTIKMTQTHLELEADIKRMGKQPQQVASLAMITSSGGVWRCWRLAELIVLRGAEQKKEENKEKK